MKLTQSFLEGNSGLLNTSIFKPFDLASPLLETQSTEMLPLSETSREIYTETFIVNKTCIFLFISPEILSSLSFYEQHYASVRWLVQIQGVI